MFSLYYKDKKITNMYMDKKRTISLITLRLCFFLLKIIEFKQNLKKINLHSNPKHNYSRIVK